MRRAPALPFLLVTVFLDTLGLGLVVPIVPALMAEVTPTPAAAVLWSGVLGSTYGLLQFLISPLLGRLADRYGRRPVLLVSLGCLGADWLAHAVSPGPWTLLVFHALAGACAGTGTVVNAYLADVTPPADRARAFGRVGAAFGLGFIAGPALGGLLGAVDVRLPFLAAAGLCLLGVAYGWFILPESRPGDRTTPLTLRSVDPLTSLTGVLRRPVLGRLAAARLCSDVARMIHQATWTFFLTHRFALGTAQIGTLLAVVALTGAIVQARAVAPIVRRLGDRPAAVTGALLTAAWLTGTALAPNLWSLYLLQSLGVLAAIGTAAAQAWTSRTVRDGEQGTVQGALTSISALAETVVPVAAGALFGLLLPYDQTGVVLILAALFAVVTALLLATTPDRAASLG